MLLQNKHAWRLLLIALRLGSAIAAAGLPLASPAAGASAAVLPPSSTAADWTLHYTLTSPAYPLAKLEPESGVYLGAYVLQDERIGGDMERFNALTGREHVTFFKYVGYGQPFPQEWVEEVKAAGAFPHIAWEPNDGLAKVRDDDYLRGFAKQAGEAGVPMFLRFASEMNGTWTRYGGDPELYKEKWKLVHDVFEEHAPHAAMLWTVLAMPEKPMESYYPGDEYVDWVGVNIYNVKYHNGDPSYPADEEDPLDLLHAVYNRFSGVKPIQISEFGASHYSTTDNRKDNKFAAAKMTRLYGALEKLYPRVKAVYYFDVDNITAYNPSRRVNDYSLTGEQELLDAYRAATASSHFAAKPSHIGVQDGHRPALVPQKFTFRGNLFEEEDVLYADESFFTRVLGLELSQVAAGTHVSVTRNGEAEHAAEAAMLLRSIDTGYKDQRGVPVPRTVQALPVLPVLQALGYRLTVDGTDIWIEE